MTMFSSVLGTFRNWALQWSFVVLGSLPLLHSALVSVLGALTAIAATALISSEADAQTMGRVSIIVRNARAKLEQAYEQFEAELQAFSDMIALYAAQAFQKILAEVAPTLDVVINLCGTDGRLSSASRQVTKNSEESERHAAANQAYFSNIPNTVNPRLNGIIVAVAFSDGSVQNYRHTSVGTLQPIAGTFVPGDGVPGSAC